MLRKGPNLHSEAVIWQWQDDRTIWHSYTPIDSKIIEVISYSAVLALLDAAVGTLKELFTYMPTIMALPYLFLKIMKISSVFWKYG